MNAIDAAIVTIWLLPLAVVITGLCMMLSDLASLQFGLPRLFRSRRDHKKIR